MRFVHNFWLEGPIDLRPTTRLNCILQDIFRDTIFDWINLFCRELLVFLAKAQQQLTEFQNLRNKSELLGHSLKLACFAICTLVHRKPVIETSEIVTLLLWQWQSESDMDSFRNACDVRIFIEEVQEPWGTNKTVLAWWVALKVALKLLTWQNFI